MSRHNEAPIYYELPQFEVPAGLEDSGSSADHMVVSAMPRQELIAGDRRSDRRYHFEMEMRFFYEDGGIPCEGSGRTEDLSSGGVLFLTDCPPPNGTEVELRIAWPFLLQNVCPVQLYVWGKVVRSGTDRAAVRMAKYEFRTCGSRSFDQPIGRAATCSIIG